jgi:hypothetical protein
VQIISIDFGLVAVITESLELDMGRTLQSYTYISLINICTIIVYLIIRSTYMFRPYKDEGKAFPLQVWSGPEGSRKLRFPDFITTVQDGGNIVSLTHRPPLPQRNTPGTHVC